MPKHVRPGIARRAIGIQMTDYCLKIGLPLAGVWVIDQIADGNGDFSKPLSMVAGVAFLMADWLIVSPFLAVQAAYYRYADAIHEKPKWSTFLSKELKKSLRLRAGLFQKRWLLNTVLLFPGALLLVLCESLYRRGSRLLPVAYLLLCFSLLLILLALILTEIFLMRYAASWYLLPECETVKSAMRRSVRLMKGHIGELTVLYAERFLTGILCLMVIPGFFIIPRWRLRLSSRFEEWRCDSIQNDEYFEPHSQNC